MPRSPISTTCSRPKRCLSLSICGPSVVGSPVALKDLNGNRAAVGGTEQAIDDLQAALLAITAVATLGQRAAAPLKIARRDIVEHEGAVVEMAFGQRGLDGSLARQQPVERGVEFVVSDLTQTKGFAQAGGRRIG